MKKQQNPKELFMSHGKKKKKDKLKLVGIGIQFFTNYSVLEIVLENSL